MNSENFSLQGILSLWDCNQMKNALWGRDGREAAVLCNSIVLSETSKTIDKTLMIDKKSWQQYL